MQQQTLQNSKEVFFKLTKVNNSHFILISNGLHCLINGHNSIIFFSELGHSLTHALPQTLPEPKDL